MSVSGYGQYATGKTAKKTWRESLSVISPTPCKLLGHCVSKDSREVILTRTAYSLQLRLVEETSQQSYRPTHEAHWRVRLLLFLLSQKCVNDMPVLFEQ